MPRAHEAEPQISGSRVRSEVAEIDEDSPSPRLAGTRPNADICELKSTGHFPPIRGHSQYPQLLAGGLRGPAAQRR